MLHDFSNICEKSKTQERGAKRQCRRLDACLAHIFPRFKLWHPTYSRKYRQEEP